jgi:hypothetical protein
MKPIMKQPKFRLPKGNQSISFTNQVTLDMIRHRAGEMEISISKLVQWGMEFFLKHEESREHIRRMKLNKEIFTELKG